VLRQLEESAMNASKLIKLPIIHLIVRLSEELLAGCSAGRLV
jgi:hypothetical protein